MVSGKVQTQDIIKGIGAGLCLVDRDFRIVWINKIQASWFTNNPKEFLNQHCYKIFEHRNHICPGCPTQEVFKTGNIHKANKIGFTKDSQKHYYRLTVSPIRDNRNRVMFALELSEDITKTIKAQRYHLNIIYKLKHMYQRISSANTRLHRNLQRLKEITKDLSGVNSTLKKKYYRQRNKLIAIKEELQKIFKINHTISSSMDLKKISSLIHAVPANLCILMPVCYVFLMSIKRPWW